jgi:hypothetical protein
VNEVCYSEHCVEGTVSGQWYCRVNVVFYSEHYVESTVSGQWYCRVKVVCYSEHYCGASVHELNLILEAVREPKFL